MRKTTTRTTKKITIRSTSRTMIRITIGIMVRMTKTRITIFFCECPNKNQECNTRAKECYNFGEEGHIPCDCPNKTLGVENVAVVVTTETSLVTTVGKIFKQYQKRE